MRFHLLVPGGQMGDGDNEAGLVGKALEFAFPEADTDAVAAAAISRDGQASRLRPNFAHFLTEAAEKT